MCRRGRHLLRMRLPVRSELASACGSGHHVRGPSADVLELTGNKALAIAAARAAGLPVLASSEPSASVDELVAAAADMSFRCSSRPSPGRWRARHAPGDRSGRAARGHRGRQPGRPTRHSAIRWFISSGSGDQPPPYRVQIWPTPGNVIHLFERDCSVRQRHQKVIELAPAPNLDPSPRTDLRRRGGTGAGDQLPLVCRHHRVSARRRGHHVFIECNPRIQVRHTVTEEITDVDLVSSQLRIASVIRWNRSGLKSQDSVQIRGAALQCGSPPRITNGFRPARRITRYRSPEWRGHPASTVAPTPA